MHRFPALMLAGMLTAAVAACAGGNSSPGASTGSGARSSTGSGAGSSISATVRPSLAASSSSASFGASAGASLSPSTGASAQPSAMRSSGASFSTSPGASLTGPQITVTAVDYQFTGMPTSVPVGTTLTLQNSGTEVHEMVIAMKNPGVTQSWDELVQMPEDQVTQFVTILGGTVAAPGSTGDAPIQVTQEGDYLMICFIPQGTYSMPPVASREPGASGAPGASLSVPSAIPSTASSGLVSPGASMGIPHFMLGMMQEFQVTAAGSTPGPIPTPGASMGAGSSMEPGMSGAPGAGSSPGSSLSY